MSEQPQEQIPGRPGSWTPLLLAGAVLLIAIVIAVVAFASNRHGEPDRAKTVNDVAQLTVEAVEEGRAQEADDLACSTDDRSLSELVKQLATLGVKAEASKVTGQAQGAFTLKLTGDVTRTYVVTVGLDSARTCVTTVKPAPG
jgi:hypothetical protein